MPHPGASPNDHPPSSPHPPPPPLPPCPDTYAERFYHSEVLHKGAELHKGYAIPDGTEVRALQLAMPLCVGFDPPLSLRLDTQLLVTLWPPLPADRGVPQRD